MVIFWNFFLTNKSLAAWLTRPDLTMITRLHSALHLISRQLLATVVPLKLQVIVRGADWCIFELGLNQASYFSLLPVLMLC